jgi:hypothetical protein
MDWCAHTYITKILHIHPIMQLATSIHWPFTQVAVVAIDNWITQSGVLISEGMIYEGSVLNTRCPDFGGNNTVRTIWSVLNQGVPILGGITRSGQYEVSWIKVSRFCGEWHGQDNMKCPEYKVSRFWGEWHNQNVLNTRCPGFSQSFSAHSKPLKLFRHTP